MCATLSYAMLMRSGLSIVKTTMVTSHAEGRHNSRDVHWRTRRAAGDRPVVKWKALVVDASMKYTGCNRKHQLVYVFGHKDWLAVWLFPADKSRLLTLSTTHLTQ